MIYSSQTLSLATLSLLLSTITLLFLNRCRRRLVSALKSHPHPPSPGKSTSSDFKTTFPPSTRFDLPLAAASLPPAQRALLRNTLDPTLSSLQQNILRFTANYATCPPATYTPTGLSLAEVRALGDFPDYASLSGVPLPQPYTTFDIEKAIPRPYRPFRWAYHQTMSLTKMEPDWWLELEKTYVERIAERKGLFQKYGKLVLNYLPGSELACKEVMEVALQFLCARYPMHFFLSRPAERGDGEKEEKRKRGYVFHNGLLGTETVVADMHPLHVLLDNVPEDFAVMVRNDADGEYYFRAGVLCSSLGWNVDTKLGMKLSEIHAPIPEYRERMQFSMDRYFTKIPPSKPIQRGSWGLEIDTPLFMPPGDPHEAYRDLQQSGLELSRVHLRVDWQTLRRMPVSGAVVFNFKALFTPIEEFRNEPHIPRLLSHILKHAKKNMMEYKNTWHVEHVALPALERWARMQEEQGVVEKGWEVRTLEESPWFPGWEEKWRVRQGF